MLELVSVLPLTLLFSSLSEAQQTKFVMGATYQSKVSMHGRAEKRHVQKGTDSLRYDDSHVGESLLRKLIRELILYLNVFEVAWVT